MITSIKNAEHYKWGENCDGWHLLKSEDLSVIEELMPPGTSEVRHYHNQTQQVFYILEGIATFEIDDKKFEVKEKESIHIPKKTTHRISNLQLNDLRFIVVSQPKSHGDRVEV